LAAAAEAGPAQADLAEACVVAMAQAALEETERQYGAQPGAFVVLALGKFGGRELAERSDLDLMLVYDAPADAGAPSDFYTRLTQRLISALSAPTEEGVLYEIDTKLRPSGSKGPVAVRLSSFERYYAEEAWTWELQALTRARAVAGDAALALHITALSHGAIARPRNHAKTLKEVADMRGLMERERRGRAPWDLKLAPGGFVDIEFIAQALQLVHAATAPEIIASNTGEALERLTVAGVLEGQAGARLVAAWRTFSEMQQVLRIATSTTGFSPEEAPQPLMARLAAVAGAASPDEVEARLLALQQAVRADFVQIVGPLGDGNAAPTR